MIRWVSRADTESHPPTSVGWEAWGRPGPYLLDLLGFSTTSTAWKPNISFLSSRVSSARLPRGTMKHRRRGRSLPGGSSRCPGHRQGRCPRLQDKRQKWLGDGRQGTQCVTAPRHWTTPKGAARHEEVQGGGLVCLPLKAEPTPDATPLLGGLVSSGLSCPAGSIPTQRTNGPEV